MTRPSLRPALACMLLLMFGAPMLGTPNARAEDLVLYGAGSLREVMTDITSDFTKKTGLSVRIAFGPSGCRNHPRTRHAQERTRARDDSRAGS